MYWIIEGGDTPVLSYLYMNPVYIFKIIFYIFRSIFRNYKIITVTRRKSKIYTNETRYLLLPNFSQDLRIYLHLLYRITTCSNQNKNRPQLNRVIQDTRFTNKQITVKGQSRNIGCLYLLTYFVRETQKT